MSLNLKKLQATARRKLGISGEIEFRKVSGPIVSEILAATTQGPQLKHLISYRDAANLTSTDVYHELCRAKLNESGFKTSEAVALNAMRVCCKDDPKYIFDANSAAVIVSEAYTNYLLYEHFPQDSDALREDIVSRFQSSDALTSLHTRMGFWGVAGISYHRLASEWAGKPFPLTLVIKAINRSSQGSTIMDQLNKIDEVLGELPKFQDRFDDSEQIQIVDVIVRLFTLKTGLECN